MGLAVCRLCVCVYVCVYVCACVRVCVQHVVTCVGMGSSVVASTGRGDVESSRAIDCECVTGAETILSCLAALARLKEGWSPTISQ